MKNVRLVAWLAVAIIGIVAATAFITSDFRFQPQQNARLAKFGGPFVMTNHKGEQVTEKSLAGKPYLIFFGFTHCPEVCPTTLLEITQTIQELGDDADKLNYVFVSVDPERDTTELLKTYLSNFDSRIIGLRGTPEQTAKIAKAYSVYYMKQPTENDYTVNHTATSFLMKANGSLASTLGYQEDAKIRLQKIKRLIGAI